MLAAEQALISANADIGVAKADFFPRISLTGLFGVASTDLSTLGNSTRAIASVGGSLLQPIFAGGRIKQSYALALARRDEAIAQYLRATQNAFREASDAIVGVQKLGQVRDRRRRRRRRRSRRRRDSRRCATTADCRTISRCSTRIAGTTRRRTSSRGRSARSWMRYVTLYRVLGGGWNADQVMRRQRPATK